MHTLLLFALLLWAELVGFLLEQSGQNSRAEIFSMIPVGKKLHFNKAAQKDQNAYDR